MTPKLTNAGKKLLLRALTGDKIVFTKILLGNGEKQEELEATNLNNPILELDAKFSEIQDNYAVLEADFSNSDLENGFHATEIGYMAHVEDETEKTDDVLYAIGFEEKSKADYIPAKSERSYDMKLNALIFVGESENVSAQISDSISYITVAKFNEHMTEENPHNITAAKIGLGNVQNVSVNEQTPTYAEAAILETLESGETLGKAFGKLKLALSSFIEHFFSRNNPHGVTAEQTGASAKDHKHSAAEINSGTLSVARGGTGRSSVATGAVLCGNGSYLKAVSGKGALYSQGSETVFGTLPVALGGTGAGSLSELSSKLAPYLSTPVFGVYTGDSTTKRLISLGFTPSAVIVCNSKGQMGQDVTNDSFWYGGICIGTHSVNLGYTFSPPRGKHDDTRWADDSTIIMITEGGFYVNYYDGLQGHRIRTNSNGETYRYIAFR